MAEFPYLPLWTDSYLADTRHLSTLEHGAYLLLMMEAWRRPLCNLPDDDVMLARLSGLSSECWAEHKGVIMSFWKLDGRSKTYVQKRLSKEKANAKKRSKIQRVKAAKRWKGTKKDDAAALPTAMPNACPDDASISRSISRSTAIEEDTPIGVGAAKRGARLPDDFAMPNDWLDAAVADGLSKAVADREARRFINYWQAAAGRTAVKRDWRKTWLNWVIKAIEDGGGRQTERSASGRLGDALSAADAAGDRYARIDQERARRQSEQQQPDLLGEQRR